MKFTPVMRKSNLVAKAILQFAREKKIDAKLLDFELISYQTFFKIEDETQYTLVEDIKTLTKQDFENPKIHIAQEYTIKIFPLEKKQTKLKLSFGTNKLKTKAVLTFLKGSVFEKSPNLFEELKARIYYKKTRSGLLVELFENHLDEQLEKLLQLVPYDKPLQKDVKLSVAHSLEPTPPTHAHIEKIFEEKQDDSIISGVDKGELVLKYFKTSEGKSGRAANGKFIEAPSPQILELQPIINDTILKEEKEDFIEYFSNESGYVVFEENKLFISKHLKLDGASFKTSANIDGGGENDKDISVHIAHNKSHSEDAVGSGVKIDVKELNIDGSVGANVNIKTQELNIDAQTHRNTTIEVANTANVKLHRGDLIATDATIDILETGKITAHKTIHIKKMLGGEAVAPIVKVDELLSNSVIIASQSIEILSLHGKDNKLIIDPNSVESYHKDIEKLKLDIKEEEKILREQELKLQKDLEEHKDKVQRIKVFQNRIAAAQTAGKKPSKQDMIRLKMFKKESDKLKEDENKLNAIKEKLLELNQELKKQYELHFHAKIILHTSYDGQTKVYFKDPKTNVEVMKIPEGKIESITLSKNEDEEMEINL